MTESNLADETPMTPEELMDAMDSLWWSNQSMSGILGITERSLGRWLNGQHPIPLWVNRPLRAIVAAVKANPFPPNPAASPRRMDAA